MNVWLCESRIHCNAIRLEIQCTHRAGLTPSMKLFRVKSNFLLDVRGIATKESAVRRKGRYDGGAKSRERVKPRKGASGSVKEGAATASSKKVRTLTSYEPPERLCEIVSNLSWAEHALSCRLRWKIGSFGSIPVANSASDAKDGKYRLLSLAEKCGLLSSPGRHCSLREVSVGHL